MVQSLADGSLVAVEFQWGRVFRPYFDLFLHEGAEQVVEPSVCWLSKSAGIGCVWVDLGDASRSLVLLNKGGV